MGRQTPYASRARRCGDPYDRHGSFWWTHLGWVLHRLPCDRDIPRYTKDIARDPVCQFFDLSILLWQVALAGLLFSLGGWPFVVWGIFLRLVAVHHCTWFVNSAAHRWGCRSYETADRSTNCWWVALLTYGEGWHNNHHAFPSSARQGLRWWEMDMTWWLVRGLEATGLAWKIKLPPSKEAATGSKT
jgi:stearoyl-CoA desaturase (delta-9 desaturase)